MESLYNYYETKDIRPTYAAFKTQDQLDRYSEQRKKYFYKLNLPHTFFKGKNILEFGPDTGENALVFSQWGAKMTLVEPNTQAHHYITSYFEQFGLGENLTALVKNSVSEFSSIDKFDVVIAEGFIYTVQPSTVWVRKLGECLHADGLALVSYMDFYGVFLELLQKAIYQSVKRSNSFGDGIETAKKIFLSKWNSIPHTRTIDSWFMDVIENPFVRMKYMIDPVELLGQMYAEGLRLFSSWPTYRNMLSMDWIKKPYTEEEEMNESISFIKRSRLSFFMGHVCFLPINSEELNLNIKRLVEITDGLIDAESKTDCATAISILNDILAFITTHKPLIEKSEYVHDLLMMMKNVFLFIKDKDADGLVKFCQTDKLFIDNWGSGTHNVIFQKR
jgi:hypothetical protein